MPSCAYWVDKPFRPNAKTWECWERIEHAGPWSFYGVGGGTAAVMTSELEGKAHPLTAFADPVDTEDGLRFYGPSDPQSVHLRQKPCMASVPVELLSGVTVEIPIAQAAPRKVLFAVGGIGKDEPDEYERLSYRLYDVVQEIDAINAAIRDGKPHDAELHESLADEYDSGTMRLAWLAFRIGYHVTEELLSAIGWVSTEDLLNILIASWGVDPKKAEVPSGDDDT